VQKKEKKQKNKKKEKKNKKSQGEGLASFRLRRSLQNVQKKQAANF